jgi:DNA-binding IclR family transcriptional regulator
MQLAEYLRAGLEVRTAHTIADADRLQHELDVIRSQGYAISREESTAGACAVAVPVSDSSGEVVAAVSVAPVASQFTESNIHTWVELLRVAQEALSPSLGPGWQRSVRRE